MNLLRGIFEILTGRASGLERIGATPRDFVVSLYVLMAVLAIFALMLAVRIGFRSGVVILLLLVCLLLAPLVISDFIARAWGKEALWLRFATAFNWSRFAIGAVLTVMLGVAVVLFGARGAMGTAGLLTYPGWAYTLWLEWFVARNALRLTGGRAILLVLAMNVGTSLLLAIPLLVLRIVAGDVWGEG